MMGTNQTAIKMADLKVRLETMIASGNAEK
jgi:hypothetical protein